MKVKALITVIAASAVIFSSQLVTADTASSLYEANAASDQQTDNISNLEVQSDDMALSGGEMDSDSSNTDTSTGEVDDNAAETDASDSQNSSDASTDSSDAAIK